MTVHSVSELNQFIAEALQDIFGERLLEGEVSEFKPHASGHWYFTLKDPSPGQNSTMSCVMWRALAMREKVPLRLGERVRLHGGIRGYAPRGTYSFDCKRIERAGEGDLARKLAELRRRLAEEGLFDPEKKRPLPFFPRGVGLATGQDSAALADMVRLIRDRAPHVTIVLAACRVQGEGAAADIARAIRWLNNDPRVDVIIAGRGGGSAEDLQAFNEEEVVRAYAASRVPIIAAVGHESDQCLAELAADKRAPTPSAAAKEAVPDAYELARSLDVSLDRLASAADAIVRRLRDKVARVRLVHPRDRVVRSRKDCEALQARLDGAVGRLAKAQRLRFVGVEARMAPAIARVVPSRKDRLQRAEGRLLALSPVAVLDRGYAIVRREDTVVRDAADLAVGDVLSVRFARGATRARVEPGE